MKTLAILLVYGALSVHSVDKFSRDKVMVEANRLPAPALASDWVIIVIRDQDWYGALTREQIERSAETCYTHLDVHVTYCRLGWVLGANQYQIHHTLAHELGHIVCNCASEWKANKFANSN